MDEKFCQVCREHKENVVYNFATGEDTCGDCFGLMLESADALLA